mgnify:CR=1|jgi:hypothetical protein
MVGLAERHDVQAFFAQRDVGRDVPELMSGGR